MGRKTTPFKLKFDTKFKQSSSGLKKEYKIYENLHQSKWDFYTGILFKTPHKLNVHVNTNIQMLI